MVCALRNVLRVTVQTGCTVAVLLRKQQRPLRKREDKNDKTRRQMERERPEENLERKKERRKIQTKLRIKIYWRLLMPSEPCRHKISTVRAAGNVCITAGNIGKTTWRL